MSRPRQPTVEQPDDFVGVKIVGKDRPQRLFELVGTPDLATGSFELAQRCGLTLGQVLEGVCAVPSVRP
jgi:hypothetical protein